jgi:hypothetical protein
LSEPVPLLCHLTDGEDYIILPTNSINGNKLSTWITCPEYKLNRATEYQITVVYSTDAIDAMLRYDNNLFLNNHGAFMEIIFTKIREKYLYSLWG